MEHALDKVERIAKSEDNGLVHQIDEQGMAAEKSKEAYPLFEERLGKFTLHTDTADIGAGKEQEQPRYQREIIGGYKAFIRKTEHKKEVGAVPAVGDCDRKQRRYAKDMFRYMDGQYKDNHVKHDTDP